MIASLTKLVNMITCLDIMEKNNISDKQTIKLPRYMKSDFASHIGLNVGYQVKIIDLFLAMCISSSYEAARGLAIYFGNILMQE